MLVLMMISKTIYIYIPLVGKYPATIIRTTRALKACNSANSSKYSVSEKEGKIQHSAKESNLLSTENSVSLLLIYFPAFFPGLVFGTCITYEFDI